MGSSLISYRQRPWSDTVQWLFPSFLISNLQSSFCWQLSRDVPLNIAAARQRTNTVLKVDRYSFSGPYLAFSTGVLPTFPWSDWLQNYTSFWEKMEVLLNVFFKRDFTWGPCRQVYSAHRWFPSNLANLYDITNTSTMWNRLV